MKPAGFIFLRNPLGFRLPQETPAALQPWSRGARAEAGVSLAALVAERWHRHAELSVRRSSRRQQRASRLLFFPLYNSQFLCFLKAKEGFTRCFFRSCGPQQQSAVVVLGSGAARGGWLHKSVLLKQAGTE